MTEPFLLIGSLHGVALPEFFGIVGFEALLAGQAHSRKSRFRHRRATVWSLRFSENESSSAMFF